MNYNFATVRAVKTQNLRTEGKPFVQELKIVAKHFANEIFENTNTILVKNQPTDIIFDNKNPSCQGYDISFKAPSLFFKNALKNAETEMGSVCYLRKWITVEDATATDIKKAEDETNTNQKWRKLWKTYLCQKIVEELRSKFQSVNQSFYYEVFARGGEKMSKMSSLSYDSKYTNRIVVKIGDEESDPTQEIFDSLFRQEQNRQNSTHAGAKSWFPFH